MKKIFSIIIINFLFIVIDNPVNNNENGISNDTIPIDWKNISAIKLPLNPSIFFTFWLSGKMKFGSSGEQLTSDIKRSIEAIISEIPNNSANLFIIKSFILLI